MSRQLSEPSTKSILKVCTLPLAICAGLILGIICGAMFGVAGMGAAVGVGIGLGIGVGLTASYAVTFFESDQ
jgi:hypothetical protein